MSSTSFVYNMALKIKIRFSLISSGKQSEEKQIFLVCTIDGIEIFFYSGFRIYPKNFIKEKTDLSGQTIYIQQAKKNTFNKSGEPASRINKRLNELSLAAQVIFERYYQNQDVKIEKDTFKRYLLIELGEYKSPIDVSKKLSLFDYYIKYKNESIVSDNRRRHYSSDINKLKEYQETLKAPITFDNFNVIAYKKYLEEGGRKTNTVVSIMKRLKAFFNYCKNELQLIDKNPFDSINFASKVGVELYNEPVCMTREELTHLYTYNFTNSIDMLVRDMFCLQAALGCRIGDFVRLTYDNIQNNTLTYYPEKTREIANKVIVPLSYRAKNIINKYKGKGDNNLIMPFINSVEYNRQLKSVFRIASLNRKIIIYNRDNKKEEVFELHQLASSHLARRTFVDILCQAGEPIHVVASMSGHSENSKAFDRYRRRPEQLQINAVNRSMD